MIYRQRVCIGKSNVAFSLEKTPKTKMSMPLYSKLSHIHLIVQGDKKTGPKTKFNDSRFYKPISENEVALES